MLILVGNKFSVVVGADYTSIPHMERVDILLPQKPLELSRIFKSVAILSGGYNLGSWG
jgi:hypothetical protein